jgi:hypothetical protein
MMASKPKVSSSPDGRTSSGNYGFQILKTEVYFWGRILKSNSITFPLLL